MYIYQVDLKLLVHPTNWTTAKIEIPIFIIIIIIFVRIIEIIIGEVRNKLKVTECVSQFTSC